MLEKNKDYVEFTLQCTSVDWERRSKDYPEVCLEGYSDFSFPGVPIMDVVCKEFDHKVVVVSKRDFERLQADNQHYRELAKQREENYKALLDKTGFYNLADLMCYLPKDKTLKGMIDSYETENEKLKKELYEFDPMPDYKELLKKLYSTDDTEKLEWTLNHICGGRGSVNGWIAVSSFWKQNYETLSKLVGFSSIEEIQDYLTNEANCDTLHEAMLKLINENKYVCEEWCKAGELIEKWRKATGYLRPEDISIESMISKSMTNEITAANENLWRENEKCEKRIEALLSEIREWRETTGCPSPSSAKTLIESGASWMSAYHSSCEVIKTWKKLTGCPTPIAAKTLIESGMSYEHGYHEAQEENRKLTEEIDSWKNITGYSTPEDYMHVRINNATPFDYTAAWQDATGCVTPDHVKSRIEGLENAIRQTNRNMIKEIESNVDEWQKVTGFNEPKDFLKWKANIEGILEAWKSGTGCKYPAEARILLEKWKVLTKCETPEAAATWITAYEKACERGNELAEKVEEWKKATGRISPEAAKQYIDRLKGRLNKIHGYSVDC